MPHISVYLDDNIFDLLQTIASRDGQGRSIEQLASDAVTEECIRSVPPHLRADIFRRNRNERI